MIPNRKPRQFAAGGIEESGTFGISAKDTTHIMTILRDTLYSDKILAVLREYSANAWDAHRMVGKGDVPIKVELPTNSDPTLRIQDFGPGLSPEDVFTVFTQYGASTKRDDDVAVGMLGIGSKSAFAYSDTFMVISRYGGKKRTYVAALDESNAGVLNLLLEEDCGDETGVTIEVPTVAKDRCEFEDKARSLFKHFRPRPDINIELPESASDEHVLNNGVIHQTRYGDSWVAVMGCIPYRINTNQISDRLGDHVHRLSGELHFEIGEVDINASREELKYSDYTKDALVKKFEALVDEFVEKTLDSIVNGNYTPWEKRLKAQVLSQLGLPIPDECKSLTDRYVTLQGEKFYLSEPGHKKFKATSNVVVRESTVLYIRDDKRALSGYQFSSHRDEYLVHAAKKVSIEEAEKCLKEKLEELKMDGIPIKKVSERQWFPHLRDRKSSPKHRRSSFLFTPSSGFHGKPFSDYWEVTDRDPEPDDVFVVLCGFDTLSGPGFYRTFESDRRVADFFKKKIPPIYGYKTTTKNPITEADCEGTEYFEWRKTFLSSLVTPKIIQEVNDCLWVKVLPTYYGWESATKPKTLGRLAEHLGKDHLIVEFLQTRRSAYLRNEKIKSTDRHREVLNTLAPFVEDSPSEAELTLELIHNTYPLLQLVDFKDLWGNHSEKWIQYVKIVDLVNKLGGNNG